MTRADLSMISLAALGVSAAACGDSLPAAPVAPSVAAWDAAAASSNSAPPSSSDSTAPADAGPPPAPSASQSQSSGMPDASPSRPMRVDAFVTRAVARPKKLRTPTDPRASVVFEAAAGLAPKPGLDADDAAAALEAIGAVERQSYLCAMQTSSDSLFVEVTLASDVSATGLHATISGAAPSLAECLRPMLEKKAFLGVGGTAPPLRFAIAVRASRQ